MLALLGAHPFLYVSMIKVNFVHSDGGRIADSNARAVCVTSDWIERQVFPAKDNRCQQSREPELRTNNQVTSE
jgi:hypothetical protein